MNEFMLLIHNAVDHQSEWPADRHQQFLKACESYIDGLKKDGKLIAAQPLMREGKRISGSHGLWNVQPFSTMKIVQVGYYHILADNLDEAIAIAKQNPEFEYGEYVSIEVRPIKMTEPSTGFEYPK